MILAEGPTAADWTAAIGQVAGALVAAAAVIVALRIATRDRRNQLSDKLEAARGQAAMVLITVRSQGIAVRNYGSRPIRDLTILSVSVSEPESGSIHWTANDHPHKPGVRIVAPGNDYLIPGIFQRQAVDGGRSGSARPIESPSPQNVSVKIKFYDNDGLHWTRTNWDRPEIVQAQSND